MIKWLLFKLHEFRNNRFTYAYSLFFECEFYDYDFEGDELSICSM